MELILRNVTYVYGKGSPFERLALDQIDLIIPSGSFTAIIGPTGSGKSTLIQHFNGLLRPTSGEARIGNEIIASSSKKMKLQPLRKKVGLVFQYPEYQLFAETVEKDIAFGLVNYHLPEELISIRVKEAMTLVGLNYKQYRHQSPFKLSGGQQRRVALAGVLALQPEALILDEPTAGLDPQGRKDILHQIYATHRKENRTTILVTHNMEDAAHYADYVVVMNEGRIFLEGAPTEVFKRGEMLRQIGLDLPDISKFIMRFNEKAREPLPFNIFSMDELVDALLERQRAEIK